jgi:diguanylate cyclase (GGDEF)-like protein
MRMRTHTRLLVIGDAAYRDAVARALPWCSPIGADHPLAGVWQMGHQHFDAAVMSLSAGSGVLRALRCMRQLAPQTRLVVTCPAADEPNARQALERGADDYLIEPVTQEDLERALDLVVVAPAPAETPAPEPTVEEKIQFVDVIKNLSDGPQATLDRMAGLIQRTFEASSVTITIEELSSQVGPADEPVLQEPIRSQNATVGAITLGRRLHGSYSAAAAARLADYARLVEAVVTVARERAHWQDLAWTDDLSRLRNRRYFERRLDELIEQCTQQRLCLTLLLLDIDDFKTYNDRFGHETGDALIREVAFLLTRCCREQDVVARYGGDEFAVLLWDAEKPRVPGSRHPTDLAAFAERFLQVVSSHQFRCLGPDAPGPVTLSGGLASFPWDGRTREELLHAADEALLTAKRSGKNRIQLAGQPTSAQTKSQEPTPPPAC